MNRNLTLNQRILKRTFDIVASFVGLALFWWVILIAYVIATIDTRESGFFTQKRVGKGGELFTMIKIKTMHSNSSITTTVTKASDSRITPIGAFFRKMKIDELPQLVNVFIGKMSFVGPRPDVPGFADKLEGPERRLLALRPGITGPATLVYKNEEEILEKQENPDEYNRKVIFPKKVKINLRYIDNYSFIKDLKYILATVFPTLSSQLEKQEVE